MLQFIQAEIHVRIKPKDARVKVVEFIDHPLLAH